MSDQRVLPGPTGASAAAVSLTPEATAGCTSLPMPSTGSDSRLSWFSAGADSARVRAAGLRRTGGGVHQSKTMMLRELAAYLDAHAAAPSMPESMVLEDNVLGKATGSARRLALKHLKALYAIGSRVPIARALEELWLRDPTGRPILALLCALARDPLLRESAEVVLPAALGVAVRAPAIAAWLEARHPGRFSNKMLKSLSRNCASSWTQSGHLKGKIRKIRTRATPTAASAAYAALLATIAGFGGPALLASPWLMVLDRSLEERLALLRQAEAQGLARVRAAGGMIEVAVCQPMAQTLGIPDLGHV